MSHLEEIIKLNQPTDPLLLRHIITKTNHSLLPRLLLYISQLIYCGIETESFKEVAGFKYLITSVARAISNLGRISFMVLTPVEVSRISISNYESYRRKTALNE